MSQEPSPISVAPTYEDSPRGKSRQIVSISLILFFWLTIYAAGMFTPPLLDDVDTIHAEAAREMVLRHDWVTLYTDGIRYLEKAPVMYWGVAASYSIFGVSDWSTRLPLMLGALVLMLATYALGKRAYGEMGGRYSAVVMGTVVGPYIYTRFQIPDLIVGLWLTLGIYFFFRSLHEERPSRFTCWGFAATCALSVLTKSLIGLVFPFATIIIFLFLTRNLRHLLKLRLISSSIVFFAIAAPWHILAALRNPSQGAVRGFLWFYFVNEQFARYLNKRVPPGYDTVPLLIFWALVLVWLIPWVVFLPQALKRIPGWREMRTKRNIQQEANLLFILWALVIVGFFTFSTRQEYYTIPALPGLALLIGGWLARESKSDAAPADLRAGRISSSVLLIAAGLATVAGVAILLSSKAPPPGTDLADLLKKNPQDYDFSLGHFLDLTPQALGAFRAPLIGAMISLLLGSGMNWIFRRRKRALCGNAILALMMVGLLTCVHSAFATFSPILSSSALARAVQRHYQPGDLIVIDGRYDQASTLNFYTGVPVLMLGEPSGNLWYGSKFPDAPQVFETGATFAAQWAGSHTVFFWSDQENPKELHGARRYLLARSGGKFIFTNHELQP